MRFREPETRRYRTMLICWCYFILLLLFWFDIIGNLRSNISARADPKQTEERSAELWHRELIINVRDEHDAEHDRPD